jgi:hypothetical protein
MLAKSIQQNRLSEHAKSTKHVNESSQASKQNQLSMHTNQSKKSMKRASLTNPSAEGQMDRGEKLVNFQHPADLGKCHECSSMYNNVPIC